jgi:hypothetical protein
MSYEMRVQTTGKRYEIVGAEYVPEPIRESVFDWASADERYVKYRGEWYALSTFERCPTEGWDGAHAFGWSAGLLIKLDPDGETCRMGFYSLVGKD